MQLAFWDSSSLVPLCVRQQPSKTVRELTLQYGLVVWWSTPAEMRAAFARLLRMGELTEIEHLGARQALDQLRLSWRELQPTEPLRAQAEALIDRFPLKAADALQLAAALAWCMDRPTHRPFISGDKQLISAASQLGFHAILS
ncbi:putative nucleic acid-binding protein [Silvibacterium bohemicum]|uniref:Putative nucleic acid-binding protein n=1 Tax=Silvibacterium bohemicum TaxID=1577686 RepID=A0A841JMC7_9BACT|nr:type II toxin-antitoxin system VapC family toxin [Silvibacterium bohemicum]MBB6142532.1 putative nucleic acid-binding protein [Silvibacterium bohemicum]